MPQCEMGFSGSARTDDRSTFESTSWSSSPITALRGRTVRTRTCVQGMWVVLVAARAHAGIFSHVVAADDVEPEDDLLHPGERRKDALVAFIQNKVGGLVETP